MRRWMVRNIGGPWKFWLLGVGLEVLSIVVLLLWFRRRGVHA